MGQLLRPGNSGMRFDRSIIAAVLILPLGIALIVAADDALGQDIRMIENGFVAFVPEGEDIRVEGGTHGYMCGEKADQSAVCATGSRIDVTARENCAGTDGKQYPCTRYGYELAYSGATAGDTLECQATQSDGINDRSKDYSITLDAANGTITRREWFPYVPGDRRILISEVHKCSYQGQLLASVEFSVDIKPQEGAAAAGSVTVASNTTGPAPGVNEPYIAEIPNSCMDLTEIKAARLLQANGVQQSAGSEHVANLSSTCIYSSTAAPSRTVNYLYKFMPYAMFDQNTLGKEQLVFNATMVGGGGQRPYKVIEDLGKFTFLFENNDRTSMLVVTGMQGPVGGGSEPRELIAAYYIEDPTRSHAVRLQLLDDIARQHFAGWVAVAKAP